MKLFLAILITFCCKITNAQEIHDFYILRDLEDSVLSIEIYSKNVINSRIRIPESDGSYSISTFSNDGELHGLSMEFNKSFLKSLSLFDHNNLVGSEIICDDEGRVKLIVNRDDEGRLDGLMLEFNESNELALVYLYDSGEMIGLLYNAKNKGWSYPPGYLSPEDSLAWRINLFNDLIKIE